MHFGTVDASLRAATSLNGRQFAGNHDDDDHDHDDDDDDDDDDG